MTVAIKESLNKMYESLQSLEKTAVTARDNAQKQIDKNVELKAKRKGPPDLFTVPAGEKAAASTDVDAKALASRLDGAIEKVEKLLKEEA